MQIKVIDIPYIARHPPRGKWVKALDILASQEPGKCISISVGAERMRGAQIALSTQAKKRGMRVTVRKISDDAMAVIRVEDLKED